MMFLAFVIAGLTGVYCMALASFAVEDVLLGFGIACVLTATFRRGILPNPLPSNGHMFHIIVFFPQFLFMLLSDILKGTWLVATFVTGLRKLEHPGIVKIPIGDHTVNGASMVGLLVTISPGSFLIGVDPEDRSMLVHYIDASDPAQLRRDLEKYYRLWEYGKQLPIDPRPESRIEGPF